MKARQRDGRAAESARLKAKPGKIAMARDLLEEKAERSVLRRRRQAGMAAG